MKVGDLVKREYDPPGFGVGLILKMFRRDGNVPGAQWTAKVAWSGWCGVRDMETQYLEVVDEGR